MPKYLDGLFAVGSTNTNTLAVRTTPVIGQYLRCTDATTGAAQWQSHVSHVDTTCPANTYTITSTSLQTMFLCTPTANAIIILPVLSTDTYGRPIKVVNLSAFTLTVTAGGTDTIWDLATTTVVMTGPHAYVSLVGGDAASKVWYSS